MINAKIQSQGAAGYVKQAKGKFCVTYMETDKVLDMTRVLNSNPKNLLEHHPMDNVQDGTYRVRFTFYKLCPGQRERWMKGL